MLRKNAIDILDEIMKNTFNNWEEVSKIRRRDCTSLFAECAHSQTNDHGDDGPSIDNQSLSAVVNDREKHKQDRRKEEKNKGETIVNENANNDLFPKADGIHPCTADGRIAELFALQQRRRLCTNKPSNFERQVTSFKINEKTDEHSVLKHDEDRTPDANVMVNDTMDAVIPINKTKQVSVKQPQDGGVSIMESPNRESDQYFKERKNSFKKRLKRVIAPLKPTKLINDCKTLKNRLKRDKSAKKQTEPACSRDDPDSQADFGELSRNSVPFPCGM
ncbi:unnamed protein product [Owenia fusiformis]|uniref:Uncharacterized protein n=1 Tax=Owenia fusiformis TaxID=6347 RepID=A0A8J1TNL6_OWEFU|nr:unnamed protein product [Owenia fusiformis]